MRNRDREFTEQDPPPKEVALADFSEAAAMAAATARDQQPTDWSAPYSAAGLENIENRIQAFIKIVAHFDHHVGQMTYLCKQWEVNGQ